MRFKDKSINAGLCKKCYSQLKRQGYDVVKIKKIEDAPQMNLNEE